MGTSDIDLLVDAAKRFAVELHTRCGHLRSNGEPYWRHPERVAGTLAAHDRPAATVAAGWLHDTVEDCPTSSEEAETLLADIAQRFGPAVAQLVQEVTNRFDGSTLSRSSQYQTAAALARGKKGDLPSGYIKRDSETDLTDVEAYADDEDNDA